MKVISYKAIKSIDENILAIYLAYKQYFPNSVIISRSALHVFNSGRTKESSYQVVNRHMKTLKKCGLITPYLNGWRLISKRELAVSTDGRDNVLFADIQTKGLNVKQIKFFLTLSKIATKLNQIEYRKITKSIRPNRSLRKHVKQCLQKNQGAFTKVSYTTLSKFLGLSRDTIRRRVNQLYLRGYMSVMPSTRTAVRRLCKLEQPTLKSGEFIYKGWIYHVESPILRVNSKEIRDLIMNYTYPTLW
jgi:hypothetical protein